MKKIPEECLFSELLLNNLQQEIHKIDREIIYLLSKRVKYIRNIGELKIRQDHPVHNIEIELYKIQNLQKIGLLEGVDPYTVEQILQEIMAQSRRAQHLQREKIVLLGYLGSMGSHSSIVAMKYNSPTKNYDTFEDLIDSLIRYKITHAILPILNSVTGIISETNDLILKNKLHIIDTIDYEVQNVLCSKGRNEIKTIYSHPEVLKQCSQYLDSGYEPIPAKSTSDAVQKMFLDDRKDVGVICSPFSANMHNLNIIENNISNNMKNVTKFYLVTNQNNFIK